MSKLASLLKNYDEKEFNIKPPPNKAQLLLKHQSSINSEYFCPVCGDRGINQFIQAECMHIFCIICYKKSQRKGKNKCCPMCMAEFEQMSTPKQRAQYVELFKEIKCVGKGAFGAAYLVMSK